MSIGALPYQLPTNVGWAYVQTRRTPLTTPPAADGVATIELPQVPAGQMWLVRRIAVSCTSPSSFAAYYNTIAPANIADATDTGEADVADERQPLVLNEGDVLICQWSGCLALAVGSASVVYDVLQKSG